MRSSDNCEYDAQVSVDSVLNIRGFDVNKILEMDPEFLNTDSEHVHDATVSSLSIQQPGDVHMALINKWVGEILKTKGESIYRMKGVLAISGASKKFVYQAVHMIFDGRFDEEWAPGEPRVNKLVFIGKNLDLEELKTGFAATLDSPENQAKIQAIANMKANEERNSQLLGAAQRDDTPALKRLLGTGIPVSYANKVGQTALHIAALWANVMSVELLLAEGADTNVKNSLASETPVHMVARGKGTIANRLKCAKKLVAASADLRVKNAGGKMAYEVVTGDEAADPAATQELCKLLTP